MNFESNIRSLKEDIKRHKQIVLIVGAGINYSKGVRLMWDDIINPMFEYALRMDCRNMGCNSRQINDLFRLFDMEHVSTNDEITKEIGYSSLKTMTSYSFGPEIKASMVKSILKTQYLSLLQEYIYSQCNRSILKKAVAEDYGLAVNKNHTHGRFYTLYTIARLILLYPNIVSVITYNYDNFLTQMIKILQSDAPKYFTSKEQQVVKERNLAVSDTDKLRVEDVYGQYHDTTPYGNTVLVYHPHGFIPSPSEMENLENCRIVLSLDEYCENTREAYSWNNDTQVHLLSHYTGILIGSSVSDLTTQRMLHYASKNGNNEKIYYLGAYGKKTATNSPLCANARRMLNKLKMSFFMDCGLTPIVCEDGFDDLFLQINEIITKYIERK